MMQVVAESLMRRRGQARRLQGTLDAVREAGVALGDLAVGALGACGDRLPDDLAVVAETELGLAVANDGAVVGAGRACSAAGRSTA